MMERLADLQRQALEQKEAQERAKRGLTAGEEKPAGEKGSPAQQKPPALPTGNQKGPSSNGGPRKPGAGTPKNPSGATGGVRGNGQQSAPNAKNSNGAGTNGAGEKKPTHPRSKTKRDRKDR
jgi:hypothetical protein